MKSVHHEEEIKTAHMWLIYKIILSGARCDCVYRFFRQNDGRRDLIRHVGSHNYVFLYEARTEYENSSLFQTRNETTNKQTNPGLKMLYRKRGTKSLLHKEKDFS